MRAEITVLSNLLTNGFIKTINGDGTLSIDTNSYALASSIGNGILTLSGGTHLTGSATFTANQSGNTSFNLTVDATPLNTPSTIISRDSSGGFATTSISATTFNGSLVGSISNALTFNTSGGASGGTTYNGSVARIIDYSSVGAAPLSGSTYYIPYTGATKAINLGVNNLTVDTNTLFVNSSTHRVGVKTLTPRKDFDIGGSFMFGINGDPTYSSIWANGVVPSDTNYGISFSHVGDEIIFNTPTGGWMCWTNDNDWENAALNIYNNNVAIGYSETDSFVNKFNVKGVGTFSTGVVIGALTAASALDVYGVISISGSTLFTTPIKSGSAGTAGNILLSTGSATAPSWSSLINAGIAPISGSTYYVSYTGSTSNLDLGSNNITANSIIKSGGTSSQFLKADGSVDSSIYLTNNIPRNIDTFIATSGQTNFTTSINYSVGSVDVFYNGSRLSSSEYTASGGTSVILNNGATLNTIIDIISSISQSPILNLNSPILSGVPETPIPDDYSYTNQIVNSKYMVDNINQTKRLNQIGYETVKCCPWGFSIKYVSSAAITENTAIYTLMDWLYEDTIITGVRFGIATQGVFTADNYNGCALYSVDIDTGIYTQVAITADLATSLQASAGTVVNAAFTGGTITCNGLYAIALIYNNSAQTTAPSIYTCGTGSGNVYGIFDATPKVRLNGSKSTTNTLPATITSASMSNATMLPLIILY